MHINTLLPESAFNGRQREPRVGAATLLDKAGHGQTLLI
jgi:hypothetical protein